MMMLVACADQGTATTNAPVLTGDACAVYTETTACQADSACTWFGTGCACPPNDPSCVCSPGVCGAKGAPGSGSGSGSTSAGCACSDGGVCYEQVGGPATMTPPSIECTTPAPGGGDPCGRVTGQGTCSDSTTVSGLCVCDNGIR
ncbi:MAG: hypothetical protein ABI467_02360 [Kofleriaceae bacterium]